MSSRPPFQSVPESRRRRSQRVILSLAVTVKTAEGLRDNSFEEETQTLVLNVHGALVALSSKVEKGQMLRLINRATREEQLGDLFGAGLRRQGSSRRRI